MKTIRQKSALANDLAARRAVFTQAQRQYLEWLDCEAPLILRVDHDRKAFNRLSAAARALDTALSLGPGDRSLLLALLQRQRQHVETRATLDRMLGDLAELVGRLAAAGDEIVGKGLHADLKARAWVFWAAGRWQLQIGTRPSAAERGHFWVSLDDFQRDPAARSAKVPMLGRDAVRAALAIWRSSGAAGRGGETPAV